jgi:hypothetical protein
MVSFEPVAAALAVVAYTLIIRDIVRSGESMNVATWVIWAVLDGVAFASAYASGDRIPWMIGVFTTGAVVIAILSIKNGKWHWGRLEWVCTAAAILSFGLWSFGPVWSLVASSLAMFVGGLPQVVDAYMAPHLQSKLNWGLFLASNATSLFGANPILMGEWFYPTLGVVFNTLIMGAIVLSPKRA